MTASAVRRRLCCVDTSLSLLQIVVLALIQGVTEFLPVSSSAHLILPGALTDWPDQGLKFDVAVHFGTLVAVIAYFRRDLAGFAASASRWREPFKSDSRRHSKTATQVSTSGALKDSSGMALATERLWDDNLDLLAKIGVATVPIVIVGVLFKTHIETHLRSTTVIGVTTIVFGVALWFADRRRGDDQIPSYAQAVLIGLAQAVALIPGTSRSGITIAAALALGLDRRSATRFSFLLAIPAIGGAAVYTVASADPGPSPSWIDLGLGFAIAAASAFACIAAFIRFVERTGMAPYVVYRILLGVLLLTFVHGTNAGASGAL